MKLVLHKYAPGIVRAHLLRRSLYMLFVSVCVLVCRENVQRPSVSSSSHSDLWMLAMLMHCCHWTLYSVV